MRYETFERLVVKKIGLLTKNQPDSATSLKNLGIDLRELETILGFAPEVNDKPCFVEELWRQYCQKVKVTGFEESVAC